MVLGPMGAGLIALAWILTAITTVIVGLRVWVRFKVRRHMILSVDDLLVLTTYGLVIVNSIFVTISADWGLGEHMATLQDEPLRIIFSIKWAFLAEGPAIFAGGFARISYAILLLGITPPTKTRRIFLWSIMGFQFAADLAAVIVTYSQCRPLVAYWDPRVKGDCWPPTYQQYIGFTQGSIVSAVDVILALYPTSLFWNLKMERKQKIYLSCIMGLGVIASAASIAKTIALKSFTETQDFTYALSETAYWWTTEISLVLFAVSIPILSPIIRPTKTMSSGRSGPSGGGGVIMNTFNSRKLKKSNGSSNTDEGDFELLEESHGYMHNNNSSDVGPPPSKTYDYSISRHNQAEQNFSTPGIKRELTVSVTRNTGYGDREF